MMTPKLYQTGRICESCLYLITWKLTLISLMCTVNLHPSVKTKIHISMPWCRADLLLNSLITLVSSVPGYQQHCTSCIVLCMSSIKTVSNKFKSSRVRCNEILNQHKYVRKQCLFPPPILQQCLRCWWNELNISSSAVTFGRVYTARVLFFFCIFR